jgi:hypothetical protein
MRGFLKRYPQFKIKSAKTLSVVRALGYNRASVTKWFSYYRGWLNEIKFNNPNKLWNIDETGLNDNYKPGQVVGMTGKPALRIVANEKGDLFTLLCYISAGGLVTPPMLVFKGHKVKAEWRELAPAGWTIRVSPTGYINAELFRQYGEIFTDFLKEKDLLTGEKNLVLLDLHKSHLFNLSYMTHMFNNNIKVCSFPPTALIRCNP